MYKNSQILAAVVARWAKPLVEQFLISKIGKLPPLMAATEWVKKYFPVNKNYNIINDISFLANPATEMIVAPMVRNGIQKLGIAEEQIPSYAMKLVDSTIEEAEKNGHVTLFNTIELERSDFERLKNLIRKNMTIEECEEYQVIE